MKVSNDMGRKPSDDEIALFLKMQVVPGKEAKYKNRADIANFIRDVNVGSDDSYYSAISEIATSGARAGGVSYDMTSLAQAPDQQTINYQGSVLEKTIKDEATDYIATHMGAGMNTEEKSNAEKFSSALSNYSGVGKSQLYESFIAEKAILKLAEDQNPVFNNALRFNQEFRNTWNRLGFASPFGNEYFSALKSIENMPMSPNKNKLIQAFNRRFGPNMYEMARKY